MNDPVSELASRTTPITVRWNIGQPHHITKVLERCKKMPVAMNFCLGKMNAIDEAILPGGELKRISPEILAINKVE